jgi:hypothetical protein
VIKLADLSSQHPLWPIGKTVPQSLPPRVQARHNGAAQVPGVWCLRVEVKGLLTILRATGRIEVALIGGRRRQSFTASVASAKRWTGHVVTHRPTCD